MNHIRISGMFAKLSTHAMKSCRLLALGMVAIFTSMALQAAQAQSSDTWKSIAIIGGSTAAGAYIGHKVAGPTGAWIGAGVGATTGYAIDRRRRANEYYNQYGDGGYYGNNDGYYGNDGGYYGNNGGYYRGPGDGYPYPAGFQSNKCTSHR